MYFPVKPGAISVGVSRTGCTESEYVVRHDGRGVKRCVSSTPRVHVGLWNNAGVVFAHE